MRQRNVSNVALFAADDGVRWVLHPFPRGCLWALFLAERCAVLENDRRVLVLAVGLWWPDLGREEKREGIEGSVGVHACYC